MCGINGYTGFTDRGKGVKAIGDMNLALQHRGPDHLAAWDNDHIALGHARLSIIDLSAGANQPFVSDCGRYIIVFNGEIYNYRELKAILQLENPDTIFRTTSDTEVLLLLYKRFGKDCLEKLNGMFAFAIWDKQQQDLFIARDRLGKKPLYYYHEGENFVFSSEIRALLASGIIPRKLNADVLPDYIQYQTVHAPHTLVANVHMLMPGSFAHFSKGKLEQQVYWKPVVQDNKHLSETEYIAQIKKTFEDAISSRLVADVKVGAFLSGGIDSSAVVAQMSRMSPKPVSTFSVIFGEKDFSEEEFSNAIAAKYNTNHHPIRISASDFLQQLPNILKAVDFPGGDGPNTYMVAQATRQTGIKVAMSGLGGDELFAGYPIFSQLYSFHQKKWLKKTPRFARVLAGNAIQTFKSGVVGQKYKRILAQKEMTDAGFYSLSRQLFSDKFVQRMLKEYTGSVYPVQETAREVFKNTSSHILSEVSVAEISTYMQNVLLRDTDQMTMAHALEVRAPFLDYRLVELALTIPDKIKYPYTPKQIFVKAMGDLLPPEVVNRKKMGFVLPWAHWMRNELSDFCRHRTRQLSKREYFDTVEIKDLWERFMKKDQTVTWSRIWHLVTLEEWMQQNGIE